jgi:DNA-binding response OmpR family regulator
VRVPPRPTRGLGFGDTPCRDRGCDLVIVDDEHTVADTLRLVFQYSGFQAVVAYSGTEALQIVRRYAPRPVLTDVGLPDIDGIALVRKIRAASPDTAIVLFSGDVDTSTLLDRASVSEGSQIEVLPKPMTRDELVQRIRHIFET